MRQIKFRIWNEKTKNWLSTNYEVLMDMNGMLRLQENEKVKLMQFTGLLDINKVEIYEGDILQIKVNNNRETIEVVKWFEYRWYPFGERVPPNYAGTDIEIIGNIYENPERLNGKQ